jgi:ABC transporter transmembrane region
MAAEIMNELKGQSKVGQIVEEVFGSIRTVLSFNGGKYEQQRYENSLSKIAVLSEST